MSLKFSPAKRTYNSSNRFVFIGCLILLPGLLILATGCDYAPRTSKADRIKFRDTQSMSSPEQKQKPLNVDVAVAKKGSLEKEIQYVGTTYPVREVSLRSRIEGQVLNLAVDVGDRVEQGQVLAQIDDSINKTTVLEAKAELAALRSEVTSLQADVSEGLTQIEQAKITLQQAQSDLNRSQQLVKEGAVTQQSAEQAQNAVDNAQQALQAAQQQVQNRNSAVVAAQLRVVAQQALVAQELQEQMFTVLTSSVTGSVLERVLEPGDLAQVGDEVLQLGDFSQIQVQVQISELELAKIQVGQQAQVQLDALPEQTFTGEVTQISLAADATVRLVPVEVTIPNLDRRIGSGLLARVNFDPQNKRNIVIPETAIQQATTNKAKEVSNDSTETATTFILQQQGKQATVTAREVKIGDRANDRVEIISGLEPEEKYVVRSSDYLQDGDHVNLSFLSE
ncbi:MAG: efflux RND transporter periplasmic adaptor subunit [Cyanobacteria bacterium J06638_38]